MSSPADGRGGVAVAHVVVAPAEAEVVADLLWGAGASAVGEAVLPDGRVRLECGLPPGGPEAVAAALGGRWSFEVLEVDDGLDGWREWAVVSRAGDHLVVRPPWVPYAAGPDDVVVDIDPGRSFGHGAHPTTRLVLAEVERRAAPGVSVLDVGCGSGVLAVAAARLGASPVVAIDIAAEAVEATRANAAANGVEVEVSAKPLAEVAGRFDLVLANIGAATIASLASDLLARLAPGGALVVSGLLADRWRATIERLEGLDGRAVAEAEGWVAVVMAVAPGR